MEAFAGEVSTVDAVGDRAEESLSVLAAVGSPHRTAV